MELTDPLSQPSRTFMDLCRCHTHVNLDGTMWLITPEQPR